MKKFICLLMTVFMLFYTCASAETAEYVLSEKQEMLQSADMIESRLPQE